MIYMKMIDNDFEKQWALSTIRPILCADTCGIIALTPEGEPAAAAIFDSFTPIACNVHMAVSKPIALRYGFLESVADYVFNTRDRKFIFGLTPEDNVRALKFNEHIGMNEIAHIPDAYDVGVGYIVTRMARDECRWLYSEEAA